MDHEKVLLNSVLSGVDPSPVIGKLTPKAFSCHETGRIWGLIEEGYTKGTPIDLVTIESKYGGIDSQVLYEITTSASTTSIEMLADAIIDAAIRRTVKSSCVSLSAMADRKDAGISIIGEIEGLASRLSRALYKTSCHRHIAEGISDFFCALDKKISHTSSSLVTYWPTLDDIIVALEPGQLVVIAGRPGSGKTSFALNLCTNLCSHHVPCVFFSWEMSEEELVSKAISAYSNVPLTAIRKAKTLTKKDLEMIGTGASIINDFPLYIDDSVTTTIAYISARVKMLKRQKNVQVVVVDYIQLVSSKHRERIRDIDEMTRGLKLLAKSEKVTIFALSQMNRDIERGMDRPPRLSDLRDSGSIEQDADIVMFVHPKQKVSEIHVAKHRHGPVGVCRMNFYGDCSKFTENFDAVDEEKDFWEK